MQHDFSVSKSDENKIKNYTQNTLKGIKSELIKECLKLNNCVSVNCLEKMEYMFDTTRTQLLSKYMNVSLIFSGLHIEIDELFDEKHKIFLKDLKRAKYIQLLEKKLCYDVCVNVMEYIKC